MKLQMDHKKGHLNSVLFNYYEIVLNVVSRIDLGLSKILESKYLSLLLVVGYWLAINGYDGIRHDNILYAGQAYRQILPEVFNSDLFFAYWTQDDFSVFSFLYASLISILGLGLSNLIVTTFLQIVAVTLLFFCFRNIFGNKVALLAIFLLGYLPRQYGAIFPQPIEPFLTSRLIAETIALFAIFFWIKRKYLSAFLTASVMMIFHPLQGLPVIMIGVFSLVKSPKQWLLLIILACFALLLLFFLAIKGVMPFTMLLQSYDPVWWGIVKDSTMVVMLNWGYSSWTFLLFNFIVYILAVRELKGISTANKNFFDLAMLTLLLGYFAAFLIGDLAKNVFFFSLQLWRLQWVFHLFAYLLLAKLIFEYWNAEYAVVKAVIPWVIIGVLSNGSVGGFLAMVFALILYLFRNKLSNKDKKIILYGGLFGIFFTILRNYSVFYTLLGALEPNGGVKFFLYSKELIVALLLLFLFLAGFIKRHWIVSLLMVQLMFHFSLWDRRDDWKRLIESDKIISPFLKYIQPADQVYWANQLSATWFLLKRPAYLVGSQSSGNLFNRDVAVEYARRENIVSVIQFQRSICSMMEHFDEECHIHVDAIVSACSKDGLLKYVITEKAIGEPPISVWQPPILEEEETWYLYSCKNLLAG